MSNLTNWAIQSVKFNVIILKLLGFYPPSDVHRIFKILYKIYSVLIYVSIMTVVPILGVLHLYFDNREDISKFTNNLVVISQYLSIGIKNSNLIFNPEAIKESIDELTKPIFTKVHRRNHQKIIEDSVKTVRKLFYMLLFGVVSTVACFIAFPLFLNGKKFPVDLWFPSGTNFTLAYSYIAVASLHTAIANIAIDSLICGLMRLATGQVQILKDELLNLTQYLDEEVRSLHYPIFNEKLRDELRYHMIRDCVEHHNGIRKYVKLFEKDYSQPIFIQLSMSAITIGFCILKIVALDDPQSLDALLTLLVMSCVAFQILFYCYFGNLLSAESDTISTAIYMGDWYNYDMKSKKALIMIMEDAKVPMIVKGGKVIEVSLTTFSDVIRMASSVMAVLRSLLD